MFNLNTLLEAANTAATGAANGQAGLLEMIPTLLSMVVIFVVFYFMLIRPQRKKDKAIKDMLDNLKVSDRVCSIGGIYGTVVSLKDDTVTLAVGAQKTNMVLARWAIRSVEDAPLENDNALV